jgi:phosphoribosylformylglycinamidine synthase
VQARIHITLKGDVLDPQGTAIRHALLGLDFAGVNKVRQGKYLEIDLAENNPAKAREAVEAMCQKLLANAVIEDYSIDIGESGSGSTAKSSARTSEQPDKDCR